MISCGLLPSQIQDLVVSVYMEVQKLDVIKRFKYLGFTWTNKMFLKPTINRTLENIQRTFNKLKWMIGGKTLSKDVLIRCRFAYNFPYCI